MGFSIALPGLCFLFGSNPGLASSPGAIFRRASGAKRHHPGIHLQKSCSIRRDAGGPGKGPPPTPQSEIEFVEGVELALNRQTADPLEACLLSERLYPGSFDCGAVPRPPFG